jgi:anti-anti-sigma regulatory factor
MAKSSIKKSATKKRVVKKKAARKSPAKKAAVKKKVARKSQKPMSRKPVKAGNKIVLKAVLAINDAKALYAELGKKLETKKDISIDASAVEMVDTAILQLLLAFARKSQLQNVAVKWVKPSHEFLSRSETLNLTKLLGLSEAQG